MSARPARHAASVALRRAAAARALRAPAVVREEVPVLRFQFARAAGRTAVRGVHRRAGRAISRAMLPSVWGRRADEHLHRRRHAQPVSRASRSTRCCRRCARGCRSSPTRRSRWKPIRAASEAGRFRGYRDAGVNRLSLGVQSFDDAMLEGARPHPFAPTRRGARSSMALEIFGNVNHRPHVRAAGPDARRWRAPTSRKALRMGTPHLSAYQLTIEPNTVFFSQPPPLPGPRRRRRHAGAVEQALAAAGFEHYETSAFAQARPALPAQPELLGVRRLPRHRRRRARQAELRRPRHAPRAHQAAARVSGARRARSPQRAIEARELPFEFMLNALRLVEGFARRPVSSAHRPALDR